MMYGDAQGDIAWWACAKLPMFVQAGVDTKVAIDGTGFDPANLDHQGWHGFDVEPRSVNPASGYVYSALQTTPPRQTDNTVPFPVTTTRATRVPPPS